MFLDTMMQIYCASLQKKTVRRGSRPLSRRAQIYQYLRVCNATCTIFQVGGSLSLSLSLHHLSDQKRTKWCELIIPRGHPFTLLFIGRAAACCIYMFHRISKKQEAIVSEVLCLLACKKSSISAGCSTASSDRNKKKSVTYVQFGLSKKRNDSKSINSGPCELPRP